MLELNLLRKNKINLADYNSQQDIENRMLISNFSSTDLKVMEEILFNPLKISLKKLTRSLQMQEKDLSCTLAKFAKNGLLSLQDDAILVDKERRKCFEFHIQRFDPNFKPDMEFMQGLLRKVPIHVLPIWYALPRSSNNIFESIVEKHLFTPQIFQRYLNDLSFTDHLPEDIMKDLFASKDFTLTSNDIIVKYNLTRPKFEEAMLFLEFRFVCTVCYMKEEDHWHEVVRPFHEWHQYLLFLQNIKAPILDASKVKKHPPASPVPIADAAKTFSSAKIIQRVLHGGWILFEQFLQEANLPPNLDSVTTLKKVGNHWKYTIPISSNLEKETIHTAIFKTLFQDGIVATGTYEGQDCFAVTKLGRLFFEG
jgi:hypothetical protein